MRVVWWAFLVFGFHQELSVGDDFSTGEELSDYLWKETEEDRQAALDSYFVQGVKNASLDPVRFGTYLVQDAIYLYYSTKGMALAGKKANDVNLKMFLLENAVRRYESLYKDAFSDWHISDPDGVYLGSACENYVNHIMNVAETMDPVYLVAACIPCDKLWPWLGDKLGVGSEDFGVYSNWVSINWDPKYDGFKQFEKVIDDAYGEGQIEKEKALEVYRESMKGEVAFFNSILNSMEQEQDSHDEL